MDKRRPTVQMLGRFQPWHRGHTELFKRAFQKTGQVVIMVRDTGETHHDREELKTQLNQEGYIYGDDYVIMDVPNIIDITYGRDVGYTVSEERFDKEIENISGTKIRNEV